MVQTCTSCGSSFEIAPSDDAFYEKMQVPPPTLCPDCRLQRRLAWRVERNLYMRRCDKTGETILSEFPEDSSFTVYGYDAWYSDCWNALDYGRDFDFSRPFFDQFAELMAEVPLLATNTDNLQNCDYVNQCGWSKNCYMTIEADQNEDSMYGYRVFFMKNCVDCTEVVHSERCYECTDCNRCFNLRYAEQCEQCSDSAFLFDCRSCQYCFGCAGLRQKSFCMFNEQLAKDAYESRMSQFNFSDRNHLAIAREKLDRLKLKHPRKAMIGELNENVSGNYIYESKDCSQCFDIRGCRDLKFCSLVRDSRDCMDYFVWGDSAERVYESQCCGNGVNNLRFCDNCWVGAHDLTYCYFCVHGVSHCFGCIGVSKKDYCILNRQYTKDEYEKLVPKIIEHMRKDSGGGAAMNRNAATGSWGEFFPVAISPYCYNETVAMERFPLAKDEILLRGWDWRNALPSVTGKETRTWDEIPDDISKVPDSITDDILVCEATGRNFRITKQELGFYRQYSIPLPRLHPDERHRRRMVLRNPRKFWKRKCDKCGREMETTYAPERTERVYCEECYLNEVY